MENKIKIQAVKKHPFQGISELRHSDEYACDYLTIETRKDLQMRYRFFTFFIGLVMLSLMAFTAKPQIKVLDIAPAADSKPEGLSGIQSAFLSLALRP